MRGDTYTQPQVDVIYKLATIYRDHTQQRILSILSTHASGELTQKKLDDLMAHLVEYLYVEAEPSSASIMSVNPTEGVITLNVREVRLDYQI